MRSLVDSQLIKDLIKTGKLCLCSKKVSLSFKIVAVSDFAMDELV